MPRSLPLQIFSAVLNVPLMKKKHIGKYWTQFFFHEFLKLYCEKNIRSNTYQYIFFFIRVFVSLSLRSKTPISNRLNQSLPVFSARVFSPHAPEASDYFQRHFFKIKTKKQSLSHMLFRWFKTWHFRCYKKSYVYKWIHSLILNIAG